MDTPDTTKFDPIQIAAVQDDSERVLVLSCAGSGKTRVLVGRIRHMLDRGVSPSRIVAITFTNNAAKTMQEHLEKHMELHKAHHEKLEGMLAKDHPMVKSSQAMMDHCEKCMKAAKDSMDGEEPEKEEKAAPVAEDAIAKAVTAALAPLVTKVDELEKKLAKTPALVEMPHTGAGNGVARSVQVDADFAELVK